MSRAESFFLGNPEQALDLHFEDAGSDDMAQPHLTAVEFDNAEEQPAGGTMEINEKGSAESETFDLSQATAVDLLLKEAGKINLLTAAQEVELAKKMEAGELAGRLLDSYRAEGPIDEDLVIKVSENRLIKGASEPELQMAVAQARAAKHHMINANLRLVVSIARKYKNNNDVAFEDLIQEGAIGLNRAVEKFDWRKGFKFSTYATWWIKQAVQRSIYNLGSTIRLPVHVGERLSKINKVEGTLYRQLGREPTNDEIAKAAGLRIEHVEEVQEARRKVLGLASLDRPVKDDHDSRFSDFIIDQDAEDPATAAEESEVTRRVNNALENFPEKEQKVIKMRYGIGGERPKSLDEIGKSLGVTRERVRQIEVEILNKLAGMREIKEISPDASEARKK